MVSILYLLLIVYNCDVGIYVLTCIHAYVGVSNLRISEMTTNTTIRVEWDPADSPSECGPVFYYIVTIVNLDDPSDMNSTEETGNRAEISNLNIGTSYNISVAAVNRVGTGPISTITETTNTEGELYSVFIQYQCFYCSVLNQLCTHIYYISLHEQIKGSFCEYQKQLFISKLYIPWLFVVSFVEL